MVGWDVASRREFAAAWAYDMEMRGRPVRLARMLPFCRRRDELNMICIHFEDKSNNGKEDSRGDEIRSTFSQ